MKLYIHNQGNLPSMTSLNAHNSAVFALVAGIALCVSGCQSFTSQAYNAEGVRRMNQGDTQKAEECFLKARSTSPADADSCYNLAIVDHKRAQESKNPEDYRRAEEYYRLCLDRNPSHSEAYRGLATLYCDQNRVYDAFALLENWNRQEIGSVEPKIELARLCNEYNRIDQAEQNLRQALAIDPKNVRAINSLGYVYEQKCQYAQASQLYCQSLQLLPSQTGIQARRCQLENRLNNNCTEAQSLANNGPVPLPAPPTNEADSSALASASPNIPAATSIPAPMDRPGWTLAAPHAPIASSSDVSAPNETQSAAAPPRELPAPLAEPITPISVPNHEPVALAPAPVPAPTPVPAPDLAVNKPSISAAPPTPTRVNTPAATADNSLPGKPLPPAQTGKSEELY